MRTTIRTIILTVAFLNAAIGSVYSQTTVQAGIISPTATTLEVMAKPNTGISNQALSNMVITIRWTAGQGLHLGTVVSPHGVLKAGPDTVVGGFEYQSFVAAPLGDLLSWQADTAYALFTIDITGGSSPETFEIVDDAYTAMKNGNWFFEVGGVDVTNSSSPFFQSAAQALLPVQMTSFTAAASGRTISLAWTTATELNSKSFEIERRVTSLWEKIGEIPASGTSNAPREYAFKDNLKNITTLTVRYRLKTLDLNGSYLYSSEVEVSARPSVYALEHNYPNPFNPSTKIQYSLPENAKVQLAIYDILGREVAELVNSEQPAGYYEQTFVASHLSTGIYFYRIIAQAQGKNTFSQVKKMMLVK